MANTPKPTLLLVTPPTAAQEVQDDIVRILEEYLAFARAGELDTIVIIASRTNGDWVYATSETLKISETIGRLEITKHEWIEKLYGKGRGGDEK